MSDTARKLADITVNLSDGLFVASQFDDDIDMTRRIDLITLGLQAIVTAMLAPPAAAPPDKTARRTTTSTPKARCPRA